MENKREGIIKKYVGPGSVLQGVTGSIFPSMGMFSGTAPSTSSAPSTSWAPSTSSAFSGFSFPSTSFPTAGTASSSGYALQTLFYFFLYGFVLFLLLFLIHFAVYPVFQFVPGGKGIIPVSTTSDYNRYWNTGTQPLATARAPESVPSDTLMSYSFKNLYSLSVDICITDLAGHSGLDRLVFYGAETSTNIYTNYNKNISLPENMQTKTAMICYIAAETNDLLVTYFLQSAGSTLQRSSIPIQNIPLYSPFRVTIVYDTNIFTVYLNGVQVSQTSVAGTPAGTKVMFFPNTTSTKCAYVQNLLLWNRPISYSELVGLPVALTPIQRFTLPTTGNPSTCPST